MLGAGCPSLGLPVGVCLYVCSYGDAEAHYFAAFGSWEYIVRMNIELAKMAARGLTVLAGAGDAGGYSPPPCMGAGV